jgi:hypothetical protein
MADSCGESRGQIPFTLIGRGGPGISSIFKIGDQENILRRVQRPSRLQRKISGKGEPLPDGDSGK